MAVFTSDDLKNSRNGHACFGKCGQAFPGADSLAGIEDPSDLVQIAAHLVQFRNGKG
jgi:hypothetical protein